MRLLQDKVNFIIAGMWNHSIFSKQWVSKYLFDGEPIKSNVELPLGNENAIMFGESFRFSTKDISIQSVDNRLIISAITKTDDTLNKIDELGIRISEFLPYTPVLACGFNIGYEGNTNELIDSWFNCVDNNGYLASAEYVLKDESISKKFIKDGNELNLKLVKNEGTCSIFLNFNFNVNSLPEVKTILLEKHFVDYKKHTADILTNLFEIEIENINETINN